MYVSVSEWTSLAANTDVYPLPSLAALSLCTLGSLAAYFQNGTLPAAGTVCEAESTFFPIEPSTATHSMITLRDVRDVGLTDAARGLQRFKIPMFGMFNGGK